MYPVSDTVLIVGDIHGKIPAYINILKTKVRKSQEFFKSIQIGDFGHKKDFKRRNRKVEQSRLLKNEHHVFFGGNHDDYDNLPEFHLGDFGEVPFLENSFFVRGARSPDEGNRVMGMEDRNWWPEEELNWKQSNECANRYEEAKPKVVLSHDGPSVATDDMFPTKEGINSNTTKLLDNLFEIHQPDLWIFGHWHRDRYLEVENTSFFCLDELSVFEFDKQKSIERNVKENKRITE